MKIQKIAGDVLILGTLTDIGLFEYKRVLYGYEIEVLVAFAKNDAVIERKFVANFSSAVMKFVAENNEQREQILTSCIIVIAGSEINDSAIKFSHRSFLTQNNQRQIPVLYDTTTKKYHTFNWYNIWGFLHAYYYRRTIRKVISFLENNHFKLFSHTT